MNPQIPVGQPAGTPAKKSPFDLMREVAEAAAAGKPIPVAIIEEHPVVTPQAKPAKKVARVPKKSWWKKLKGTSLAERAPFDHIAALELKQL